MSLKQDLGNIEKEDDYELVHTYHQEADDLSSITATSSELDNDSQLSAEDVQGVDSISLQMPDWSESSEFTETGSASTPKAEEIALTEALLPIELAYHERELCIYLHATPEAEVAIMQKLVKALRMVVVASPEPNVYAISGAEDGLRSTVSLRVVRDLSALRQYRPFLFILVEPEETPEMNHWHNHSTFRAILTAAQGTSKLPLHQLEPAATIMPAWLNERNMLAESILESDISDHGRRSEASLIDFLNLSDDRVAQILRNALTRKRRLVTSRLMKTKSTHRDSTDATIEKVIVSILMICGLATLGLYSFAAFRGAVNWYEHFADRPMAFNFHHLSSSVTLVELPRSMRSCASEKVPRIEALVSRAGVVVPATLKLTADNLYSLDWSPSDAYGELVVSVRLVDSQRIKPEIVVLQYSSGKSISDIVLEKVRKLDHTLKDFASTIELDRKFDAITHKVEEESSHAVQAVKDYSAILYKQSSETLRQLQDGYKHNLDRASNSIHKVLDETSTWSASTKQKLYKLLGKQVKQARRGQRKAHRRIINKF